MRVLLIAFCVLFSVQSFAADCREIIQIEQDRRQQEFDTSLSLAGYGSGAGVAMIFVHPLIGAGLFVIFGGDLAYDSLRLMKHSKVLAAIDEAYAYKETSKTGRMLNKVFKKVRRKINSDVTMDDIADAIILSNENGDLCSGHKRNIREMSKELAVTLE